MKKKGLLIVSALVIALSFSSAGYAIGKNEVIARLASHIKVTDEGRLIDTSKDIPLLYDGRTYLPVRAVGEALGYKIEWINESSTVKLSKPDQAYPIINVEGLNIIDSTGVVKHWSKPSGNHRLQYEMNIVVEQTKSFEHAPVITLEVLNSKGTVVDARNWNMRKDAGKHSLSFYSNGVELPNSKDITNEEAIERFNKQFTYRLKIN